MRTCILIAVIVVILTNDSCADEQTNQNNLITTYDPGELPLGTSIGSHLPEYEQITDDDELDHYQEQNGRMRFEDQTSDRPIKFEDDAKEHKSTATDENDADSVIGDVSFGDGEHTGEESRSLHKTRSKSEEYSRNKIKFEDNNEAENFNDQEFNDYEAQSDTSQVVFEDNGKFKEDYAGNSEEYKANRLTYRPIKFETNSETKSTDFGPNTVTERVVFRDDSKQNQQPLRKKKRKPRKKPVSQRLLGNLAMTSNQLYPGLSNSEYPGYPGPVVPNSGYPVPSTPGYQGSSYAYSGYMTYPPYPGSPYQPVGQGYGLYPASGHQGSHSRPPLNPGLGDQNGNINTRYPSPQYPGSSSSGRPAMSYPAPVYPYNQDYPVPGYAQAYPGDPSLQYHVPNQAQYRPGYSGVHQPGYQSPYGSSRRPKSLTQQAVSAVAEALTSIALYDDQQCVPKLLCDVAGGSTSSSSMLLKATAGLQPLLTVLQSYNGVSSSPLFVFSKAAVTGVASKGNPSACRQAYPQCPNDPEKLLNYLNNHNGGFFRFFGQPELSQQPQNLEQFYSYLSGQNGIQQQTQQNYGYLKPGGHGFQTQNPYGNPQKYGLYREQNSYRNASNTDSEIEARIQNKPDVNVPDDDNDLDAIDDSNRGPKWLFPDEGYKKQSNYREQIKEIPSRFSKTLKFPDDRSPDDIRGSKQRDYVRKQKSILFPGERYSLYRRPVYQTTTVNPEEYVFDHIHNFYVKRPEVKNNDDVVYIVRGNGDPNHPEIVKLKPGQSVF